MSIQQYFEYKGQKYGYGTKLKVRTRYWGIVETTYLGDRRFDGLTAYDLAVGPNPESYIVEIIEPVYYMEPELEPGKQANIFFRTGSGSAQHDDDVFHGFLLYLAVMIGGIIFKDRWLIWIMATIVYFTWLKKK